MVGSFLCGALFKTLVCYMPWMTFRSAGQLRCRVMHKSQCDPPGVRSDLSITDFHVNLTAMILLTGIIISNIFLPLEQSLIILK